PLLRKPAGVYTNNSHSDTRYSSLITRHLHSSPFLSFSCALFALIQNSTHFFSIGSALFCPKPPGHQRGETEIPHCGRDDRRGRGKPRYYKGEGNDARKGASTERRKGRTNTRKRTMFRRLPGIADIVPLHR